MSARRRAPRIEDIRAQFLTSSDPDHAVPPELLRSWRRSQEALGVPANVRDVPRVDEDLLDNRLVEMFQAPMARVAEDLEGSGMGLLLADAQGRILQRWSHDRMAMTHLDRLGSVRGAVLAEDAVGTNGIGTAIAAGRSVQIEGAQHFADLYQNALCTGAPVWHPITGKLLAVVTVSTTISERSGLLLPLTNSVAAQLEEHVLDVAQPGARAMLVAFLDASANHPGPVVAFGPDGLTMRSQRAGNLTQTDIDMIGHLCAGMRRSTRVTAALSTGTTTIDVTALDDGAGVVAALRPAPRSTAARGRPSLTGLVGQSESWRAAAHHVSRHIAARQALIVAGEPGSGKTSLALGRPYIPGADVDGAVVVHAAERQISGDRTWLQRLADILGAPTPVIIRGVETLDGPTVAALRTLVENNTGRGAVLLTMAASSHVESEAFAARLGAATVWVPPLRDRVVDVAILWNAFAAQRAPGMRLELTDDARRAAEAHSWPGNLMELRGVVEHLVASGKRGLVPLDDLPDAMRGHRAWSMIERTEIEAIRRALQEAGGNRSRAAELLGISRATIHRKLKTYHISG
ncbi:Fis family transcriptional regulator [Mycobacterium sp. ACS1612]|uniref:sigma-54-dependent Fis family transcriptional regulator n=1 Tax=Mycobacterium sp. ACS1612 TaxID=1834117 RepID=UPI0007FFA077|nr:helix-turn-helix domain-containing protein [Mycobacterium sp. ACS1612]OBF41033.1 Fis family transcriptional regulator [Mycobacterium sp. ACS1612]